MDVSTVIEEQDPTWMTPIIEFIGKGILPQDQKDARRVRRTAQNLSYEITSYIDVPSYNLGSDALDLSKQIMYFGKSMPDHVPCTQDHGPW